MSMRTPVEAARGYRFIRDRSDIDDPRAKMNICQHEIMNINIDVDYLASEHAPVIVAG